MTKGVGIEQIYPSVGASIKASGLWILNVAQDVFLLMFTFVKLFKEFWDAIYFSKFCESLHP